MLERENKVDWNGLLVRCTKTDSPDEPLKSKQGILTREENIRLGSEISQLRSNIVDFAVCNKLDLTRLRAIDPESPLWGLVGLYRDKVNKMTEGNLGLVKKILKRHERLYEGDYQMRDQLFMAGVDGLMHAARRYDPWEGKSGEKTVKNTSSFSTYAWHCIEGFILSHMAEREGEGSRGRGNSLIRMRKDQEEIMQEMGTSKTGETGWALLFVKEQRWDEKKARVITEKLLSGELNPWNIYGYARWRNSIRDMQNREEVSGKRWKVNYRDEGGEWDFETRDFEDRMDYGLGVDVRKRPTEQEVIEKERSGLINEVINLIRNERERKVLENTFGFNGEAMTLEEIGEECGLTRWRVWQYKESALEKARMILKRKDISFKDIESLL